MADASVETPDSATLAEETLLKKTNATGVKKPAKKSTHPPTSEMVNKAIADLKERGGSSLQAIKKYITTNYKVDADRLAPFVKKYIISAVDNGALVRTKGKGAAGSFKLDSKTKSSVTGIKTGGIKKKKPSVKKPADSSEDALKKKKPTSKKVATKQKDSAPKTPKKAAAKPKKAKTPSRAKKVPKLPTNPKIPKPKKAKDVDGKKVTIKK